MPTEADTCRTYVVPKLHAAGWEDDFIAEQRVIAPGRIVPVGKKHTRQESRRPDYILLFRRNYPIAVVVPNGGLFGDGVSARIKLISVNLDVKNPNVQGDFEHLPPEQLAADILNKEQRIADIMAEIQAILGRGNPA